MTNSESSLMAILLGLGIFAIIVAIGWRSVQNRRILRLQGPDGKETIIVAREDDEISSVVTTTETERTAPASAPSGIADPAPAPESAGAAVGSDSKVDDGTADVGRGHGGRPGASTG